MLGDFGGARTGYCPEFTMFGVRPTPNHAQR
jgi:hypothetical protein